MAVGVGDGVGVGVALGESVTVGVSLGKGVADWVAVGVVEGVVWPGARAKTRRALNNMAPVRQQLMKNQ